VSCPSARIATTPRFELAHDTVRPGIGSPYRSEATAVSCIDSPVLNVALRGDALTSATGTVTATCAVPVTPPMPAMTLVAPTDRLAMIPTASTCAIAALALDHATG
jgi:hypothetical protein